MDKETKDVSCADALTTLQSMYHGYLIGVSCNIHDDNPRQYWSVTVSKMQPPQCPHCQLPEKVRLATVHVAKTFAEALNDIQGQLELHGIQPASSGEG